MSHTWLINRDVIIQQGGESERGGQGAEGAWQVAGEAETEVTTVVHQPGGGLDTTEHYAGVLVCYFIWLLAVKK